ncbi:MAG: polysaccharide biosynthesis C-terminal domain-containing protein [Candidatus Coatesbacteria bacterium]|nr:MAG: polysaccharide biosynthesis C-terminal domain-containing protein [Candidatus Coatesbacteria bacterium]
MAVPVKRTVGAMSFFNAAALLFGAVQAVFIARAFGTERAYDLYLLVAVVPEILIIFTQNLFAALVMPYFHRWAGERGEPEAWRELWNVTNIVVVVYIAAAAVLVLAAPYVGAAVIPGADAAEIAEGASILRLLAPIIVSSLCLRVFLSVHNARESFVFPAALNAVPPLIITASVLTLAARLGVYAIAAGALAGSVVQAVFLSIAVLKKGARHWRPTLNPARPAARAFFAAAAPLAAGAAADQLNTFVDRNVAARVAEGAVSSLKYGFTIMGFAAALFSIPLARVSFMYFSRDAAGKRKSEVSKRLERTLSQLTVFYVPASVGLFILAEPAIGFLFHGGRFDAASLALTVAATRAYAVGLLFFAALSMVRAAAYGLQRYWFFSAAAVGAVVLTVGADVLFAAWFGHWGIALARGLVNALWVSSVLVYLGTRDGVRLKSSTLITFVKVVAAAAVMGVVVWWLYTLGWDAGLGGRVGYLINLIYPTAAGVILYAVLAILLKVEPARELLVSVVNKFKRTEDRVE